MPAAEPFGTRIAKRRHVLGLSQQELADRIGVARDTVSMWERNRQFPHRHLGKLEQVLGISLGEPEGGERLEFDAADRDEATIASWTVFSVGERQQKIYELREARRRAPRTA